MAPKNNTSDKLEGIDYVQRVDKHTEDLVAVKVRLDELEKKFGSNEQIADTLCQTDEKTSKFPEMLAKRFIKLLQTDEGAKVQVQSMISDQLKKDWRAFALSTGGKIAFLLWTIFTIWLGHIWK